MSVETRPVNESIQEINTDSWIIGNRILLSRRRSPSSKFIWSDGKDLFYTVSEAPYPLPPFKILDSGATREHVTLDYLHNKPPLSFAIPEAYYHAEYDGRYYIILSKLIGNTLNDAWFKMDETQKQQCVSQVTNICKELAVWQADEISGVDGQYLSDRFLTRLGWPKDCDPQNLINNCKDLGMDCSILMFYHCNLGPENIIVNPAGIGNID
ncbi:hypothetical protein B7494_g884 [Chlorociboria aeruginascens]|nr:hypothetical protein B7494_g884 [Chlorociboria aeruginascens]